MDNTKEKTSNEDMFLFIAFWVSLLVECGALFKCQYLVYGFSRILIVPILLLRIAWLPYSKGVNIFIYMALVISLVADCCSVFARDYRLAYTGLSLYAIGYLAMACFLLQLKKNHFNSLILFFIIASLAGIIGFFWLYVPELHNKIYYIQILYQAIIIALLVYAAITAYLRWASKGTKLYFFTSAAICLTNIVYALDILYFKRKYPVVDALVGLGNGAYMYLFTKASVIVSKKA